MSAVADEQRIDIKKLRRAVQMYLDDHPKESRRSVSLKASEGRNADVVRDIFRVDKRQPLYETVVALAGSIGRQPSEFLVGINRPDPAAEYWLTVASAVEAGAFRHHSDWPRDEWFQILVEPPEDDRPHDGIIVRGRSMDKIFPPGTILDCIRTIGTGVEFQDGDYVVVECRQGALVETTVKKAVLRPDGAWELQAESTLPEFREPIFIGRPIEAPGGPGFDAITDNETRVKAVVIDAYLPLRRRKTRPMPENG